MATPVIVDASFTLKTLLPNRLQPRLLAQMEEWQEKDIPLFAPTLWLCEVTSTLAKWLNFRQISAETAEMFLDSA